MRWKISDRDHDPRQVDLLAALVILMAIGAACFYFTRRDPPSTAAFIVPSQSVRW